MNNWISVKDRLPEGNNMVLVCVNGTYKNITFKNAIQIADYSKDEGWIIDGYFDFKRPKIDYWMPLPEPPEMEGATNNE